MDSERDFPRDLSFSLSFSRSLSRLPSRSLPFLSLSVSGDACLSKASAVNQQRRCVQRLRTGGGTYRLVTSLLGLLLVLLGLFIASLCIAEQKMSVNVSGGSSSHHRLLPCSLRATHQTRRWRSAQTETWTGTSSSSCGTPPPRTRSPDGDNDSAMRAGT